MPDEWVKYVEDSGFTKEEISANKEVVVGAIRMQESYDTNKLSQHAVTLPTDMEPISLGEMVNHNANPELLFVDREKIGEGFVGCFLLILVLLVQFTLLKIKIRIPMWHLSRLS